MLEIAHHLIGEPGIHTPELIGLFSGIPFLNDRDMVAMESILLRVRIANQLLPTIRSLFADEMAGSDLELRTCHQGLIQAEELASAMNTPYRETMAAFARTGVQTAIHLLLNDQNTEIKRAAKTNLIFFSVIEMLALGTMTGSYQFCHVDPQNANPEFFTGYDTIRPIIKIRPGEDEKKFKGSIVFGETPIERVVVPVAGQEFYHIANDDSPPSDPGDDEE